MNQLSYSDICSQVLEDDRSLHSSRTSHGSPESREYIRNKEKGVSVRGSPCSPAALVIPIYFQGSLSSESSLSVAGCLLLHSHPYPPKPRLLAAWLSCDMEELTGLHGYSNPLV